jgi:alanine racemase
LDLETALWNFEQAQALASTAAAAGRSVRVHFKVDSGMGRLGLSPGEAADFIRKVSGLGRIVPVGLMSHLGQADEEEGVPPTLAQFEVVRSLAESLRNEGILPPLVHTANSAGGLAFLDAPGGLVRCGILLYGCLPRNVRSFSVAPAMSFRSYILQVKPIAAGAPVGYGATYRREAPGKIALVAVGYADGYPRLLSNRADALVGGSRAPVVGRVSMDLIALDVTHLETVREGEEVVLFGAQNEGRILVEELADRVDTIPYEILCGVSARVPRLYLKGGRFAGRRMLGGEPKESRLVVEGPA